MARTPRIVLACLLFILLVVLVSACASSPPREATTLSIEVTDASDAFRLSVSSTAATRFLEKAMGCELRCGGDLDADTRRMLEHLDRKGRRYRMTRDDTVIVARRRGDLLRLDIRPEHGNRVELELPWKAAQCLLGRTTEVAALLEPKARLELVVHGDDGSLAVALD
jgi:hypothetical protein